MRLIFVGLGKMGGQCVAKLSAAGHTVVVVDPDPKAVAAAVANGAVAASSRQDALTKVGTPNPVVWMMIPSDFVRLEVVEWLSLVPPGSIIVDGGNSNYRQTIGRASAARRQGVGFIDVGTSGGILGLQRGFSMMVGGERPDFEAIQPLLNDLSAPGGSYIYAGPTGAGHFVKMVHNGIEYGLMQAYSEGFDLLKHSRDFPGLNVAGISQAWQHGSIIESKLNDLVHKILTVNPELSGIDGFVDATGEAKWTLETASQDGVAMPVLKASVDVRTASQAGTVSYATKLLAALRNAFGGHKVNK